MLTMVTAQYVSRNVAATKNVTKQGYTFGHDQMPFLPKSLCNTIKETMQ